MSSDAGRIHPELDVVEGEGTIRLEVRVDASTDEVWSALTDPGRLGHWLGVVEGDLRQGGTYRGRWHASGWEGAGRIETCEPRRRLRVVTVEDDSPGEHAMEVTLAPLDAGSQVVVQQWNVPAALLDAYGAGLQIHVEDLISHLAGGERCDADTRWSELQPGYAELAKGLT